MTALRKYYDVVNKGDSHPTYTRDSWVIPEAGTEIWCTAWKRGQTIRPYGDGCHVIVGLTSYHCDQFLEILLRLEQEGYEWGVEVVVMKREQQINGCWSNIPQINLL